MTAPRAPTQIPRVDTHSPSLVSACERLTLSRERLRLALRASTPQSASTSAPSGHSFFQAASGLKDLPGAAIVLETLTRWWATQPMRPTLEAALKTIQASITPLVRRYPIGVAAGAMVLGAVVVVARPWRWLRLLGKPALYSGLGEHVLAAAIARAPLQAWMDAVMQMAQTPDQPTTANAAPAGTASPPP